MVFAPTAISALAILVGNVLQLVGIDVLPEDIQTTLVTLVTIVGGVVVYLRQIQAKRATLAGTRPKGFQE